MENNWRLHKLEKIKEMFKRIKKMIIKMEYSKIIMQIKAVDKINTQEETKVDLTVIVDQKIEEIFQEIKRQVGRNTTQKLY